MNYLELKTNFQSILNRRDVTPSQVELFMQLAIQRIQRNLRVPAMERIVAFTGDGTNTILIPPDLLEIISVYTDDSINQNTLVKRDLQTVIRGSNQTGIPTMYCRNGGTILYGAIPVVGTFIYLSYYTNASSLAADTDTNWITLEAPDLLIYGALTRAADYFLDDRKQLFEETYTQIEDDLRQMALQDELVNGSITGLFPPDSPFYSSEW